MTVMLPPPLSDASRVTAEGQITLRRNLLDHLGARPGDRLRIVAMPGGRLAISVDEIDRVAVSVDDGIGASTKGSWDAFFGSIKNDGSPPLTIDEINEVIAKGWAGELDD